MPKKVQKQVLHITITSKTAEQMKNEYNFSPSQMLQYNELSNNKYSSLWDSIVYSIDSSEYLVGGKKVIISRILELNLLQALLVISNVY